MFEQAVQVSQAMQQAARQGGRGLIPALAGCRACRTMHMVATPVLGRCEDCGAELSVLDSTEAQAAATLQAPGALTA